MRLHNNHNNSWFRNNLKQAIIMTNPSYYHLSFKKYIACLSTLIFALLLVLNYNQEGSVENKVRKNKSKPPVFYFHNDDYIVTERNKTQNDLIYKKTESKLPEGFQIIGKIDVVNASQKEGKCTTMVPTLEIPHPNCNLVHEFDIFEEMAFVNSQSKIMGVGGECLLM